jgi:hypothetical protein
MLWLLLSSLAWADPVMIEAEGPGVVRVRAAEGVVYMPACGGVSWERFDPEVKVFLPIPGLPCGPLSAVLKVGPDGVEATLKAVLPPALEGGVHVVRAVVLVARKCKDNKPFPLAGCEGLSHYFGPNQVVHGK